MLKFYAIQDVDTGLMLPFTKKGYTYSELCDPKEHPPRLLTTYKGACLARAAWLRGIHRANWECWSSDDPYSSAGGLYVDGFRLEPKADRKRTNLKIVKVFMTLEDV